MTRAITATAITRIHNFPELFLNNSHAAPKAEMVPVIYATKVITGELCGPPETLMNTQLAMTIRARIEIRIKDPFLLQTPTKD